MKLCKLESCDRKHHAKNYCTIHYNKFACGNYYKTYMRSYMKKYYLKNKVRTTTTITNYLNDGRSGHPLYQVYINMLNRCLNSNDKYYKDYGGRGIGVCERWADQEKGAWFFYKDMGDKPTPAHSLDRANNDKGYSPENCRWATKLEQTMNRRVVYNKAVQIALIKN